MHPLQFCHFHKCVRAEAGTLGQLHLVFVLNVFTNLHMGSPVTTIALLLCYLGMSELEDCSMPVIEAWR